MHYVLGELKMKIKMEIEDQLTSLELSKRLKELGVKQDSYFVWREYPFVISDHPKLMVETEWILGIPGYLNPEFLNQYSAFSVAELGEILPETCEYFSIHKRHGLFILNYGIKEIWNKKEADARAELRIYLLENGLIKND